MNDLSSEVDQDLPAGLVLATFLVNVAMSPTLYHRKFVHLAFRILKFLLDSRIFVMPLPIWNKLLGAFFLFQVY